MKWNSYQPIVDQSGKITDVFRYLLNQLLPLIPTIGEGTPEGVIEALQYSTYIDEEIPLSPVMYKKMLPDIGGNKKMGWAMI